MAWPDELVVVRLGACVVATVVSDGETQRKVCTETRNSGM